MKIILNNACVNDHDFKIHPLDRSFSYGDGLFETIIVKRGEIKFLAYHLERLLLGMEALSLSVPDYLNEEAISENIYKLMSENMAKEDARIKLQAWRQQGGLYTPTSDCTNILFTFSEYVPSKSISEKVGISKKVNLTYTRYSQFKTCNALPYVLAGIEKKERKLDEIIITDTEEHISECSSSNIFWIKDEKLFTPTLATGCIAGVMRRHILTMAKNKGLVINQVKAKRTELLQADAVFCCNVTGFRFFESIEDTAYDTKVLPPLLSWIGL